MKEKNTMNQIAPTEKRNFISDNIDLMTGQEIATIINQEDQRVALAIEKILPQIGEAIEKIAHAFLCGGRLGYFGAGTSGRLGVLDASECPPTYGVSHELVKGFIAGGDYALRYAVENSEDSAELAIQDLQKFSPKKEDIVVGISASGNPTYVLTVLKEAQKIGCTTIGISSNPDAKMKQFSSLFLNPIVGAEVITGSSRMKSGTAQKMILNMLTTGAMIRIGKTYKNLMIDLNVSNSKLYDRACRIISEICNTDYNTAQDFLEKSNKKVKTACVMLIKNCSKTEAEKLLAQNQGILRKII